MEVLQGRYEDAIRHADRALALAEELGVPRPAMSLGSRAYARANLGDSGGLQDFREAIQLANEAGQGRIVGMLDNNLGVQLWGFAGPQASLTVLRDGVSYAKARGLTERIDILSGSALDALVDAGEHEEAFALAAELVPRLRASGDLWNLAAVKAAETRILTMRGHALELAAVVDWLEASSRQLGGPEDIASGLGSAALARAALGQDDAAVVLLNEVRGSPEARRTVYYSAFLPAATRAAMGLGDHPLAERLVSALEPRYPYAEHALVAANAALTEARGELQAAADAFADAADRWERFGVVPEHGFALLGQGRCLVGIARPTEAVRVLQHAHEIFERLQAGPALAETDALLEQATALNS